MLKHIVMWKFKSEALGKTKERNISDAKSMIENLKSEINSIVNMELGINSNNIENNYDLILYSEFNDESGLMYYQNHPKHVPIIEYMKEVVENRACIDFNI